SMEERDPYDDYEKMNEGLSRYDISLQGKVQIVVASKMDMPCAAETLKIFKDKLQKHVECFPISSLNKEGVIALVVFIADTLDKIPKPAETDELVTITHIPEEAPFPISRADDGANILSGPKVERLFQITDFTSDGGT